MKPIRKATGTREWSEASLNVDVAGCPHGCLYCYARERALRFKLIRTGREWAEVCRPRPPGAVMRAARRRYGGVVMMPTTHDLHAGNAGRVSDALETLLRAGSRVLLVTKADAALVPHVVEGLRCHGLTGGLEVRVTLGTLDAGRAQFWEPGAPAPEERLKAIEALRRLGVRVSASCEPLLDWGDETVPLLKTLHERVDGDVWVGTMNRSTSRTAWCNEPGSGVDRGMLRRELERVRIWQSYHTVRALTREIEAANLGRIRFKDGWERARG